MESKICTRCKIVKPLDSFSRCSRNRATGTIAQCKACNALYEQENKERNAKRSKLYRERVKERRASSQKIYRKSNQEKYANYFKGYYAANKERIKTKRKARQEKEREYSRRYAKQNRPLMRALCSKRKAMQKRAMPHWADLTAIKAFYQKAEALSMETGIVHQVDHIVPIRSKFVCGLHCQQNLQILTATKNNEKGNRVWPDMP